jgi:hypothetical protein
VTPIPPAPKPQQKGFLVVLRPEATPEEFRREHDRLAPGTAPGWHRFLADVGSLDASRYAGWDRYPVGRAFSSREIAAWADQRESLIAATDADPEAVPASIDALWTRAEHLMTERLGEDPTRYWPVPFVNAAVIADLAIAREVLAATEDASEREIIHLTRIVEGAGAEQEEAPTRGVLGFDVGYWGGPFSLLSDTMLYPRWHPSPEEAVPALRKIAATLNEHMLFPTAAAAMAFRQWYRGQTWAEFEEPEGEFCVACVARA